MSRLGGVSTLGAVLLLVGWSAVQAAQTPGVLAKAGRLAQPTATGDQAITGVGFQPKVVFFWMTGNTGDGSAANVQLSVGAATSATNQWYFAGSAQDGSSTGFAPVRRSSTTAVAGTVAVGSPSVLAEAQLKSLDADGFTLTWTVADSVPRQVTYLALGGISLTNAYVGSYNLPATTGNMAVTGVGFRPDALLVLANPGSLTALPYVESGGLHYESGFVVPYAAISGEDASILLQNDAAGSASSYQAHGVVTSGISTTGVISQARLLLFGSDGFTLNFSAVSGLATPEFYVAVKGPLFLSGSFNQATAVGNQAVPMGFQPAAVLFNSTGRASSTAVVPGAKLSLGLATSSTNRFALFVGANSGVPTAASQSIDSTEALDMMTPAGASPTTRAAFDFVSNNAAGGFTINNTAVDATSREVKFLAIGQPVAAAPSFSPYAGIYSVAQTVSLSTATSGASIRYTTDGSTPSDTAGTLYTGPIKVSVTTTISAVAYASGFANSPVSTTTYTIGNGPAAAPTFNPPGGTWAGTLSVAISTTTIPASIRYTTNGSTPSNTAGTLYTGPMAVGGSATIKAIAYATGLANSPVSTAAYTIVPPASISSLSPASGLVGTVVTVTGSNFGASQASSTVSFNGVSAGSALSWSAGSITVAVPSGATSGNVVVTVYGTASNGVPFTVIYPPSISGLSPASGPVGTAVTIAGSNFGASQGGSTVSFNGISAGSASNWSAGSITVAVPGGATSGNVVVTVNGSASNGVPFTVIYPPAISGLSPTSGAVGTAVTITGSNFGASQGASTVTFNGTSAGSASNWSAGSITVAVPSGATTGNVVVTVNGLASNGVPFTVTVPPSISGLSPASGPVGTAVVVAGSSFGASQSTSTVTFNGTGAGNVSSWSDGSITVAVPAGATTGNVVVTVGSLASNGMPFTVTVQPSISGLLPAMGPVGRIVTIAGSNFGASQGNSTVTFNGTSAGSANGWTAANILMAVPSGATTGNVVVTVNGLASNGALFTVTLPPVISSVSPTSGAPGVQVTISGMGFGSAQGTGSVWLGSRYGTVASWSDTQIVATVASNAMSGDVQVQQGGALSNAVPFSVATATISSVTPASGVPGTSVVIAGSGFGAAQGSGQVWLGTANGVVQSWSDAQVVAAVGAGSASGSAMVLQNGVMSNAVPFTVNSLQLTSISPNSGAAGTSVTFTGAGFGIAQGNGAAQLGSAAGQVASWSDTQIVATVATGALSGMARVQQNGVWSNSFAFTVPGPDGSTLKLVPHLLNMVVGDTHTIQAVNAAGQPVTGLTWASSDSTVVSLSTDDPPVLTAVAAGHVTITAGTGSADVTVYAGAPGAPGGMPLGTVLWSNPADASGGMVPAVPSGFGVADVFAFGADGTVQAITADGTTAWTADLSQASGALPDFQGGLVTMTSDSIVGIDGMTGQTKFTYSPGGNGWGWTEWNAGRNLAVHPDGTVFALQVDGNGNASVVGIDGATGALKFSVAMASGYWLGTNGILIAGDGYAYAPYSYTDGIEEGEPCFEVNHVRLLRVDSSGSYNDVGVMDFGTECWAGDLLGINAQMITNADQGILFTFFGYDGNSYIATTAGAGVSVMSTPMEELTPVLQAQDGSFVGTAWVGDPSAPTQTMIAFDQYGGARWMAPGNWQPQIATADGGVIATDQDSGAAVTFDQNGSATGVMGSMPTYSWLENAYQDGPVTQVLAMLPNVGLSFAAWLGGSPSPNGAYVQFVPSRMFIPFGLTDPPSPAIEQVFYQQVRKNFASPTKVAVNLLVKGRAALLAFESALAARNMIVGFIGHSLAVPGTVNATALCLADGCIGPKALMTSPPDPLVAAVLDSGFAPQAKVIFLGACGIDQNFINQWHLQKGQALIVPVYFGSNTAMHVDLLNVAWEWQSMLLTLAAGKTVNEAVVEGNNTAAYNNSQYKYTVIPAGGGSVTIGTK